MASTWWRRLVAIGACEDAVTWCKTQPSLAVAWRDCSRGDWMLWLIGRHRPSAPWSDERKPIVMLACAIARTALKYTKDPRVLACIETTERRCRDEATPYEVRRADAAAHLKARAKAARLVREHFPKPPRLPATRRKAVA